MTEQTEQPTDGTREAKTMHCRCGNDTYHIEFDLENDRLRCSECGRVSSAKPTKSGSKVSIQGLGETGQTATVDQQGRISIGRQYEGETIRYAFEVVDSDDS